MQQETKPDATSAKMRWSFIIDRACMVRLGWKGLNRHPGQVSALEVVEPERSIGAIVDAGAGGGTGRTEGVTLEPEAGAVTDGEGS